jgi:hypothetical protein
MKKNYLENKREKNQPLTIGLAKAGITSLDSNTLHQNLWLVASSVETRLRQADWR